MNGNAEIREVRPRKCSRAPRTRAAKRRIAPIGFRYGFTPKPSAPLGEEALQSISATLRTSIDRNIIFDWLQEAAGAHLRRLGQPQPSRDETASQLRELARAANAIHLGYDPSRRQSGVWAVVPLNDTATGRLLVAVGDKLPSPAEAFTYLRAPQDWGLISSAAAVAAKSFGRGDYPDLILAVTTQELVSFYELATGERATWSSVATGPVSKDGTRRQIAGSACGRFMQAFFAATDPWVTPTRSSNALRKCLNGRSKLKGMRVQSLAHPPG